MATAPVEMDGSEPRISRRDDIELVVVAVHHECLRGADVQPCADGGVGAGIGLARGQLRGGVQRAADVDEPVALSLLLSLGGISVGQNGDREAGVACPPERAGGVVECLPVAFISSEVLLENRVELLLVGGDAGRRQEVT